MADQSTAEVGQKPGQEIYTFNRKAFDWETDSQARYKRGPFIKRRPTSYVPGSKSQEEIEEERFRSKRVEERKWLEICSGIVSRRWAEDPHAIMDDIVNPKIRVPSSWLSVALDHPNLEVAILTGENRPLSYAQKDYLRRRLEERAHQRRESLVSGETMGKWKKIEDLQSHALLGRFRVSVADVEAGNL